jgi:hypothetical protein
MGRPHAAAAELVSIKRASESARLEVLAAAELVSTERASRYQNYSSRPAEKPELTITLLLPRKRKGKILACGQLVAASL